MRKNSDTLQGYKYSLLGLIPEDWQVKRLGDLVEIKSGESPSLFDLAPIGLYPYVKVDDLNNCSKYQSRSREYAKIAANAVKRGSTIFPKRGAAIMNNKVRLADCDILMDSNMMAIMPNTAYLDEEFLYYRIIYEKLYRIADTSTIPQINNKHIIPYKIPLPSLSEQKRIVNLLNTWDNAIEKQTELIEKLRLRKRGLMQQLLTGKKRLPGFTTDWKQMKLGDVCTWLRNVTFSRDQLNGTSGACQNVHYGDVLIKYQSILDCNNVELPYINDDVDIRSTPDFVQDGDIIMSDTAEDETVGKACEAANVENRKILAGLHTMLIRPKAGIFAPCFLGYYINSEVYRKQLFPLIQGIKVCSLGKQSVQNTILAVPSIIEQVGIVKILSMCDLEIQSATKKKAEFQSQKRGLMQQLLTGKKRIIIED